MTDTPLKNDQRGRPYRMVGPEEPDIKEVSIEEAADATMDDPERSDLTSIIPELPEAVRQELATRIVQQKVRLLFEAPTKEALQINDYDYFVVQLLRDPEMIERIESLVAQLPKTGRLSSLLALTNQDPLPNKFKTALGSTALAASVGIFYFLYQEAGRLHETQFVALFVALAGILMMMDKNRLETIKSTYENLQISNKAVKIDDIIRQLFAFQQQLQELQRLGLGKSVQEQYVRTKIQAQMIMLALQINDGATPLEIDRPRMPGKKLRIALPAAATTVRVAETNQDTEEAEIAAEAKTRPLATK